MSSPRPRLHRSAKTHRLGFYTPSLSVHVNPRRSHLDIAGNQRRGFQLHTLIGCHEQWQVQSFDPPDLALRFMLKDIPILRKQTISAPTSPVHSTHKRKQSIRGKVKNLDSKPFAFSCVFCLFVVRSKCFSKLAIDEPQKENNKLTHWVVTVIELNFINE